MRPITFNATLIYMLPCYYNHDFRKEYTKKKYKDNIASFGLILFCIENKNTKDQVVYFLLQERRDSFEYGEYVQGLWTDVDRLKFIFAHFSTEEVERNRTYGIDELWEDLWIDKDSRNYKEGYARAKKKYDEIDTSTREYLKTLNTDVVSPPWGFPKGRKTSYSESDKECAIRESEEECRVPQDLYKVLPFKYSEKFTGSNGVNYSTTYFLCEIKEKYIPPRMDTSDKCIRKSSISEEVNDVKWLTYEEACAYLNSQRQSILYEANKTITEKFLKNEV